MKGLNPQISSLLEDVIHQRCFALENFLDLLFTQAENSRKLTTQIGCLEWIEQNFLVNFPELISVPSSVNLEQAISGKPLSTMSKSISMVNLGKKPANISNSSKPAANIKSNLNTLTSPKLAHEAKRAAGQRFSPLEYISTRLKALLFKEKNNQKFKESCAKVLARINELQEQIKNHNEQNKENEGNNMMKSSENFKKIEEIETLDGSYTDLSVSREERSRGLTDRNHHMVNSYSVEAEHREIIYDNEVSPMMCAIRRELDTLRRVWLNGNNAGVFSQKCEAFLELLDTIDNEEIQSCQDFLVIELTKFSEITKYAPAGPNSGHIDDKVNEFVGEALQRANKRMVELSPKNLSREIKWIIHKNITGRSFKKNEHLLDTAYMTCSLEVFLKETIRFLEKLSRSAFWMKTFSERMTWSLTHYSQWLAGKIEKAQNYILNDKFIHSCENFFTTFGVINKAPQFIEALRPIAEALQKKLTLKVNNFFDQSKLAQLTQSSERGNNFQTPKSRRSNSFNTFNTNILNTVESIIHERSFRNELKAIENDFDTGLNNVQALERLRHLLDSAKKFKQNTSGVLCSNFSKGNSPHATIISPSRHWKRGMGRDSPGKQGSNLEESRINHSNCPTNAPTFSDLKSFVEKICDQFEGSRMVICLWLYDLFYLI
jgi:hypothetical protein